MNGSRRLARRAMHKLTTLVGALPTGAKHGFAVEAQDIVRAPNHRERARKLSGFSARIGVKSAINGAAVYIFGSLACSFGRIAAADPTALNVAATATNAATALALGAVTAAQIRVGGRVARSVWRHRHAPARAEKVEPVAYSRRVMLRDVAKTAAILGANLAVSTAAAIKI